MTREQLALAHHRFYCHASDPDCTEVDDADYDFADFALDQAGEVPAALPKFILSEHLVVPMEES